MTNGEEIGGGTYTSSKDDENATRAEGDVITQRPLPLRYGDAAQSRVGHHLIGMGGDTKDKSKAPPPTEMEALAGRQEQSKPSYRRSEREPPVGPVLTSPTCSGRRVACL